MRELPADANMELAFIRSILPPSWDQFLKFTQFLNEDVFTEHRPMAQILFESFRRGIVPGPVTSQTVANEMGIQIEDFNLYYNGDQSTEDANRLGELLLDIYSRRLEVLFADEMMLAAYQQKLPHQKRLDDIFSGVHKLLATRQKQHGRITGGESFEKFYKQLLEDRTKKPNDALLSFAWHGINELGPALEGGDMVALAGDSGAGKTIVLEQQAEFWAEKGYHGVLYHLELSSDRMADRRVCRATGIPMKVLQDVREGHPLKVEHEGHVRMALEYIKGWKGTLELQFCPGWSMSQIVADIRQRVQVSPLDFVMVDYLGKIRIEQAGRGTYVTWDLGQAIELYKSTLDELGLVGWLAAQFPKGRDKKRTMTDVRDTGELEDKCNVAIIIYREEADGDTGKRGNLGELRVTKFNAGKEDTVKVKLIPTQFKFVDRNDDFDF